MNNVLNKLLLTCDVQKPIQVILCICELGETPSQIKEHSPQPPRPLAGQYPFPLSRGQYPMLEVYSNDIKHSLFFCRSPIYPHCICEAHPCRVWQKFFTHVFVSRGGTRVLVIPNRACDWFLVWWPGLREPVSALYVNPLLKVGTCFRNLASLL